MNALAQSTDRCRTCVACGHVHPYERPVYRCENCRTWGQDFYELRPLKRPNLLTRMLRWIQER